MSQIDKEKSLRFSKFVQKKMEEEKVSLRELARLVGVSPSYFSLIFQGKRNVPSDEIILKMAVVLNIFPPENLLIEAGTIPDRKEFTLLMRSASTLSKEDINEVMKVIRYKIKTL